MRFHQMKAEIKALKDELENLQDAGSAIDEAMGDPLKLFVGECFIDIEEDAATQYHEKLTEEKEEEMEKMTEQLDEVESEMKNLKSYLYARFGQSINLEENK